MITLGVDVGTTHTKVMALDAGTGRTLALRAALTPVRHDAHGDWRPPGEVLDTVVGLLVQVVAALERPADIIALCCASVGEEVVLVDAQGRPIADAIAWFDPRGLAEAGAFAAGPGAGLALAERYPPDPSFSIFKLLWTRDHEPRAIERAASWTDLGDAVLAGLGAGLVMDWSHASRAGAFDLRTRTWDRDTIEAASLQLEFPRLVPSGSPIGTIDPGIARRIGLPAGLALVSGGHDHACAAFGAGVRTRSELFLSAGTSEAHLALRDEPVVGTGGRYRLDQGCYVDERTYYVHVAIPSGHVFRQWRGLLYPSVEDEVMYAEIAAAGTDDIVFELQADLRHGRLDDLPYTAGRAAVMRAILEGLARRSADIVGFLEEAGGAPFELIVAAGHPTRVPTWRGIRQVAYDRPVASVDEPESAAFGAAVIAARAVAGPAAHALVASRSRWDDVASSDQATA